MEQLKLTPDSQAIVGIALRTVVESRERMNSLADDVREQLEKEARALVKGESSAEQQVRKS